MGCFSQRSKCVFGQYRSIAFCEECVLLRLGVVLLWCLFILCVTRAAERSLSAMSLRVSSWAALSLLLLSANAFMVQLAPEFAFNPGALLLCIAAGIAAGKACGGLRLLQAAACAVPASVAMLALARMQATGVVTLPEPGLFLALVGFVFLIPLRKFPAAAIFGLTLAPLLLCVWQAGLDLYAFGYAILQIGGANAFDAQVAGAVIAGLLLAPYVRIKRISGASPSDSHASP